MTFSTKRIRKELGKAGDQAQDWLDIASQAASKAGQSAMDTAQQMSRKVVALYPSAADKLSDAGDATAKAARQFMDSTRRNAGGLAIGMGQGLRQVESSVLKIGFVYVLYRIFSSPEDKIAQAGRDLQTQIRNEPVKSAIIALGAGVILGKLLS